MPLAALLIAILLLAGLGFFSLLALLRIALDENPYAAPDGGAAESDSPREALPESLPRGDPGDSPGRHAAAGDPMP